MGNALGVAFASELATNKSHFGRQRTRRITPEAGRALEILGHAIEYLADELMREARLPDPTDPQIAAIQLLMQLNRQIYYECPPVNKVGKRICEFLLS